MFKDLKEGFQVSLLDKSGKVPHYYIGTIIDKSDPRIDERKQIVPGQPLSYADLVIDLTIEFNGKTQTYTVPEQLNIATVASLTLACSAEPIANEVRAMLKHSQSVIESVPHHEEVAKECENILEELHPASADTKRLDKLEESVGEMKGMLEQLVRLSAAPKSKTKGE